ncbi:MAG: hypothetical protein QM722_22445 [Piscinibacter sp.]
MSAFLQRWLTHPLGFATLCTVAAMASAQTPAARKADPLDAGATVPAVAHESVFGRARRAADSATPSWREANDNAARIGGWRAYAREAQQPEPTASVPAAAPARTDEPRAMPMPHRHGGPKTP